MARTVEAGHAIRETRENRDDGRLTAGGRSRSAVASYAEHAGVADGGRSDSDAGACGVDASGTSRTRRAGQACRACWAGRASYTCGSSVSSETRGTGRTRRAFMSEQLPIVADIRLAAVVVVDDRNVGRTVVVNGVVGDVGGRGRPTAVPE